jgi:hypothetical protein
MKFPLNNERAFKVFLSDTIKHLVWNVENRFYIFSIFKDRYNCENLDFFIRNLSILVNSYETNIDPVLVIENEAKEYIFNIEVNNFSEISEFIEENYGRIYSENSSKNKNKYLDNNYKEENDEESFDINKVNKMADDFSEKISVKKYLFSKLNPNAEEMFSANGTFYQFAISLNKLNLISKTTIFKFYKLANFNFQIVVDDKEKSITLTSSLLSQETNLSANDDENAITFLSQDNNVKNAYLFHFERRMFYLEFNKIINRIRWEASSKKNFDDLDDDDKEWVKNLNNYENDESMESDSDIQMDFDDFFSEKDTGGKNKTCAQSYSLDRTFILREDHIISVYKSDENRELKVKFN